MVFKPLHLMIFTSTNGITSIEGRCFFPVSALTISLSLSGQVVVPEELRFPHACCVGIASQTSLSLFNPSERWQQVSITVTSLAIDGEKVIRARIKRFCVKSHVVRSTTSNTFCPVTLQSQFMWWYTALISFSHAKPYRWTACLTSGLWWRTRLSLAPRVLRSRRCCSSLHRLVFTSVSSVFVPGLPPLRQRWLPEQIFLLKGLCLLPWPRTLL